MTTPQLCTATPNVVLTSQQFLMILGGARTICTINPRDDIHMLSYLPRQTNGPA